MKVVIQCAGRKRNGAGRLTDEAGAEVNFVAHPEIYADEPAACRASRPDDPAGPEAVTWREVLVRYNERYAREGANPDRLLPAGDLYSPRVYGGLTAAFGPANVYVLSAGWGLVRADFLLPDYDITFSTQPKVPRYARRGRLDDDSWRDFNHLRDAGLRPDERVHFFGGRDYMTLYYRLADELACYKVIHHKTETPSRPGYECEAYTGRTKTNWHYPAAEAFIRSFLREAA